MVGCLATKRAATYKNTPTLILLSPHIGGKEMLPIVSSKGLFGVGKYLEIIDIAREMISNGQGDELIQILVWYWITTPRSIVDLATNFPHLVEEASRIKCPVLFIRGNNNLKIFIQLKSLKNSVNRQ